MELLFLDAATLETTVELILDTELTMAKLQEMLERYQTGDDDGTAAAAEDSVQGVGSGSGGGGKKPLDQGHTSSSEDVNLADSDEKGDKTKSSSWCTVL